MVDILRTKEMPEIVETEWSAFPWWNGNDAESYARAYERIIDQLGYEVHVRCFGSGQQRRMVMEALLKSSCGFCGWQDFTHAPDCDRELEDAP